jgi:hypothetical protein
MRFNVREVIMSKLRLQCSNRRLILAVEAAMKLSGYLGGRNASPATGKEHCPHSFHFDVVKYQDMLRIASGIGMTLCGPMGSAKFAPMD